MKLYFSYLIRWHIVDLNPYERSRMRYIALLYIKHNNHSELSKWTRDLNISGGGGLRKVKWAWCIIICAKQMQSSLVNATNNNWYDGDKKKAWHAKDRLEREFSALQNVTPNGKVSQKALVVLTVKSCLLLWGSIIPFRLPLLSFQDFFSLLSLKTPTISPLGKS